MIVYVVVEMVSMGYKVGRRCVVKYGMVMVGW